jgi:hypothetical protein
LDGTWGAFAKPRPTNPFIVRIQTSDLTQGTSRRTQNVAKFFGAMFDRGILLVNGVDFSTYGNEIRTAYLYKAYFGAYPVSFWDCFATAPTGGYPATLPVPIGTGPIPADVLGSFSTVIWLANAYPDDADWPKWLSTPILPYLEAGGNVILLTKQGSSFLFWALSNYLGITWAETNTTINATSAAYAGLTSLRLVGAQSTNDVFQTTLGNSESTLLFKATGSFTGARGIGVWRKPAAGGAFKKSGGNLVFISGRNYRWNHSDLQANMEFFLNKFMGEQVSTGVEVASEIPLTFSLSQNYPNPFNPVTTIRFEIPQASTVSLKVFDVLGREVKTLVDEVIPAGIYHVRFDGSKLPSGVYFYRLQSRQKDGGQAGQFVETKKLVLTK